MIQLIAIMLRKFWPVLALWMIVVAAMEKPWWAAMICWLYVLGRIIVAEHTGVIPQVNSLFGGSGIGGQGGGGGCGGGCGADGLPKIQAPPQKTKTVVKREATDAIHELNALIGLGEVKAQISQLITSIEIEMDRRKAQGKMGAASWEMNYIFSGNPGTGKTTVARLLGQIMAGIGALPVGHTVECTRPDLVGEHVGETGPKTRAKVEEAVGGVMFIDEAYSLYEGAGGQHNWGKECIDTLVPEVENRRGRMCFILAGYTNDMRLLLDKANPGLRSRFTTTIHFPDYSPEDMGRIFDLIMTKGEYILTEAARAVAMQYFESLWESRGDTFGNARDVRTFFGAVCSAHAARCALVDRAERVKDKAMLFTILAEDVATAARMDVDLDALRAEEIAATQQQQQENKEQPEEKSAELKDAEAKQDEGQDEAVVRRFKF